MPKDAEKRTEQVWQEMKILLFGSPSSWCWSYVIGFVKKKRHQHVTGWWFQIFFLSSLLGEMIQFD